MNRTHSGAVYLCAALVLVMAAGGSAAAATGTVTGTVVGPDGGPVPGANVSVVGTRVETTTDRLGRYRLAPVPAGEREIEVRHLGFADRTLAVTVSEGGTATGNLALELAPFAGSVTVEGSPILSGQAQALSEQKNAPNIVNVVSSEQIEIFPDTNAAEATQRVPGLFIQRDQGEGRYVQIRGTAADLNRTQIDGEVIPAPESGVRQVALDVVPADLLETMVVSKALTPDQDADAIGGIVNLEFKDAPADQVLNANLGGYYGDLRDGGGVQAGATWGGRFADGDVGLLLSASYTDIERNTENFEADSWEDGAPLEFETRDYNVTRERKGFVGALDWRATDASVYRFKGIFNEFGDQEYRRRVVSNLEDGELERELKDREEVQQIWTTYFEGENAFDGSLLSYKLSYAHAEEAEPKANYPVFVQEDVEFAPAFAGGWFQPNALNEDFGEYLFDELETNDNSTEENIITARVDFQQAFDSGLWKAGLKFRGGEKSNDTEVFVYESEEDLVFSDFIDPGYHEGSIVQNQYISGPAVDPDAVAAILGLPGVEGEKNLEEDLADFDATEDIYAAYAMTELYLSDTVLLLPGIRYEYSDVSYEAFEFDADEETLTPVAGGNSYGEILPNAHLRVQLDQRSNLRAAITRSLARPNYEDVVPRSLIIREDNEIERGNAGLDPTTAWNLDLMYERFFTTVGVVSAGVFYKDLQDYIFVSTFEEIRGDEVWEVTQPLNGDAATLWGLELAYQNQFRKAPGFLSGFGIFLNYTWTDSEATIPGRDGDSPLPGQPEEVGNIALSYEKGFFSGILSYNIQGEWLEAVGGDAGEDEWVDERSQLDVQAQVRLTDQLSVFAQVYNLTDEGYRRYVGTADQPLQEEYYSWWGLLGLKFRL
ncbi:MAG: TonB-dependent receptor [Thermoanaerobaculales bacterium]|nr:TonB-dependent receptor [Thermoanaerobaculales bacterium]